jgi:hypothetical protein
MAQWIGCEPVGGQGEGAIGDREEKRKRRETGENEGDGEKGINQREEEGLNNRSGGEGAPYPIRGCCKGRLSQGIQ